MSLHMSQARTSIYICHCTCLKPGLPSTYVIAHVSSQGFHLHMSLHMSQARTSIYICHCTCLKPGLPSTYVIAHVSSQDFQCNDICRWKPWLKTCAKMWSSWGTRISRSSICWNYILNIICNYNYHTLVTMTASL
jgi:hypothetical protein